MNGVSAHPTQPEDANLPEAENYQGQGETEDTKPKRALVLLPAMDGLISGWERLVHAVTTVSEVEDCHRMAQNENYKWKEYPRGIFTLWWQPRT